MAAMPSHKELLADAGIDWPLSPDTEDRLVRYLSSARDAQAISFRAREQSEKGRCTDSCTLIYGQILTCLAIEAAASTTEQASRLLALMYARGEPKTVGGFEVGKLKVGAATTFAVVTALCIVTLFGMYRGIQVNLQDGKLTKANIGAQP